MDNNNHSINDNAIATVSYSAQINEYNLYVAQVTASTEDLNTNLFKVLLDTNINNHTSTLDWLRSHLVINDDAVYDGCGLTWKGFDYNATSYRNAVAWRHCFAGAQAALEKKLHKYVKKQKDIYNMTLNTVAMMRDQLIKKQEKECLINSLASKKFRVVELRKQLLLAREPKLDILEKRKNNVKKLEEKWLQCKNRFERIPFIKMYVEKNNEVESIKRDINFIVSESEKIRFEINTKKTELLNMRNKKMVELADFMINKLPVILKNIQDETNSIIKLKNEKQSNTSVVKNKLFASDATKLTTEAKTISIEIEVSPARNKACDTSVLPKLHLTDMDSVPINFNQNVSYNNTALTKRRLEYFTTKKLNTLKKANVSEKPDEINISTYFYTKPKKMDGNNTTKYSDKKLIRILEDVKLDTTGAYQIVSQLKRNQGQHVNVIEARQSQDLKTNDPSQDNVNKQSTEEIEEIDLTKKLSQEIILPPTPFLDFTLVNKQSTAVIVDVTKKVSLDVILPPTQFLDLTQTPQEKRVTFNDVVAIEDLPNMVTDDEIRQEDDNVVNNTLSSQLNASSASDDSYEKIKNFVFKKHNVNPSPEFTYTKVPMVTENIIVTSKFFDENQEGNNTNSAKMQNMEISEIVNDDNSQPEQVQEIPAEQTLDQANTTSKKLSQDPECTKKDHGQLAVTSFANYIRDIPCSLNISTDTTSYEDDAEFPQYIDSSLLLSPKADDEMQTRGDNKVETQSQEIPNFLSGFKKPGFSLFGSTSSNKPEADGQNQNNNNFALNFAGNKKTKRGGFFSMFQ